MSRTPSLTQQPARYHLPASQRTNSQQPDHQQVTSHQPPAGRSTTQRPATALLLTGLITALLSAPLAADLYISPTGSDSSGDGSIGNPWRTLEKAGWNVSPGETVYARGGTYTNAKEYLECSGTANQWITFTEYPGEEAIFDAAGASIGESEYILRLQGCEYVIIEGFEFKNSSGRGIGCGGDANQLIFRNNIVHDVQDKGIGLIGDNILVEGNEVYNACMANENSAYGSSGWPAAINTWQKSDNSFCQNITVRNNYVHNIWGEGIIALMADNWLSEGNIIRDVYSVCHYVDNSINVTIRDNLMYLTTDTYVRLDGRLANGVSISSESYGGWTLTDCSNIKIYNNLMVGTYRGVNFFSYSGGGYDHVEIVNNVIKDTIGYCPINFESSSGTSGNICKNNIIYESDDGSSLDVANDAAWTFSHNNWPDGMPWDATHTDTLTDDPQFVNPTMAAIPDGFQLQSTSPCIGTGTPVTGVTTDYWDNPRDPVAPCMGIHEYGAAVGPTADLDDDGDVDIDDLTVMAGQWLDTGSPSADIDESGLVNLEDFAILCTQWD